MANKQLSQLETKMSELFVDKAPKLPDGGKKFIVDVAPWLTLLAGVFALWAGYVLWHWAHVANGAVDSLNAFCNAYAGNTGACADISDARLTVWVWVALVVVLVQGVLYVLAFPGLRDRKKQGWNYVFYASLVSVVYAVVSLFTGYNAASSFIGGLIGAVIGFWLLFQVRSAYTGSKVPKETPKTPAV